MVNLNEIQILILLKELFDNYGSTLSIHRSFIPEVINLLGRGGAESQFISKLEEYLINLQKYGDSGIGGKGSAMEHLVGQAPLCSMRFLFSGSNMRVLFVYQDGIVYILSAFHERAGHKNTEYSKYIPVAKQRFDELKKEG